MTIQEFLAAQGLTPEEVQAVVGNEKQAKAMSAALSRFDEGSAALTRAEAEKKETADYWTQKTTELQGTVTRVTNAERRAAQAEAKAAERTAYLKSLADQGYDVPKEMYEGSSTATPEPPKYMTREDLDKAARATAPDLVSLTALSNEYYDLFGTPYVAVEEDFKAAQAAGKPLRDFARSKYNFDAKRQEKQNAASEAAYQKRHAEDLAKAKAEWALTNGSNPETRSPMPSKFDRLSKQEGFKNDSWKSRQGREENRSARLKKFENLPLQ